MIFSQNKMFGDKFEITLANNNSQRSTALPNVIDLGASDRPFRVRHALQRDIGGGDPIPIMASLNSLDSDVDSIFSFVLQTSPDNANWHNLYSGDNFTSLGYRLNIDEVPSGTDRYLRMVFNNKYVSSSAVKSGRKVTVTAAIGTYQPSQWDGL